jgi:hypothetical protein
MKLKLFALAALFVLSGCALFEPNPVDVADGQRIVIEAQVAAENAEQAREFAAQEQVIKIGNEEAASFQRQQLMRGLYRVGTVFGSIALAVGLLAVGAGVGYAAVGTGQAIGIAAKFKATLIYMDAKTGTYPHFVIEVHSGPKLKLFAEVDPNTHSSRLLNENHEPDRQAVVNAGHIAALGIQTHNGRVTVHQGDQLPVDHPQIPLIVQNESRR